MRNKRYTSKITELSWSDFSYVIHKDNEFHERSPKNYKTRGEAIKASRGHCNYLNKKTNGRR